MTFRRLPKTHPRRPQEGLKDFREAANTTQEVPNAIRTLHSSPFETEGTNLQTQSYYMVCLAACRF